MANSKISALTSATTPLAGTETLPIVQGGVTVKTTVANITNGGGYAGSFTTLASTSSTTLGSASTDTVRVNGYMGVGGAASASTALLVGSPTLTGTTQRGIDAATTFGTGATASIQQIRALSTLTTAGAYTEWIGLNVPQPQGTGYTLTNAYGLYIQDQTKGTNNYGVYSAVSSGAAKYNIYVAGTAQNYFSGNVLIFGAGGLGYATGSGGTVTQGTSRTTGVTLNKTNGAITMFTAAGSVVAATFTVTNSTVAATDTIILNQKSGTNLYVLLVTAVAAGSFNITFYTTGGIASDTPVINFSVIKAVTA